MNPRTIGFIQSILASVGFGFLGYFGKLWIQTGSNTQALIAYRFCLSAILYAVIIFIFKRSLFKISKSQLFICIGLGIFGYALFASLYFYAISGLSIALASLLLNMHPLILSLISAFLLRTKLNTLHWTACSIGTLGLGIFLWGEVRIQSPLAVIAGLGAATSYAAYLLVSSRYQGSAKGGNAPAIHSVTSSFYVISTTAIVLSFIAGTSPLDFVNMPISQLKIVVGISIVSTIVPLTLVLAGLQKIRSHEAALISMAEPLTASIISWSLLSDPWNIQKFGGAALVVLSILMPSLRRAK